MPAPLEDRPGGVLVRVRVQPKASREKIDVACAATGLLKVALTAPPVDGAANAALIALLAKALGVPKSSLSIVAGEKSREKSVFVLGKTAADAAAALGISLGVEGK